MVEGEKRPGWRNAVGNLIHETVWRLSGISMAIQALWAEEGAIIRNGKVTNAGLIVKYGKEQVILDLDSGTFIFPNEAEGDKIVEVQPPK